MREKRETPLKAFAIFFFHIRFFLLLLNIFERNGNGRYALHRMPFVRIRSLLLKISAQIFCFSRMTSFVCNVTAPQHVISLSPLRLADSFDLPKSPTCYDDS